MSDHAKAGPGERYETSALGHSQPDEHKRLRLLERTHDAETIRILRGIGLHPEWRCLDLGAGAGSISGYLGQHCAEVTATDTDTRFLDHLTVMPNVRVLAHDVVSDSFPAACFELVHARCLLEHLPDRDAVLTKASRWVAPGGWLVLTVSSTVSAYASPHPAVRKVIAAMQGFLGATIGSDFEWAPKMPTLLAQAGFSAVDMSVFTHVVHGGALDDDFVLTTLKTFMPTFVTEGWLSEADATAAMALFTNPSYVDIAGSFISAWGRSSVTAL